MDTEKLKIVIKTLAEKMTSIENSEDNKNFENFNGFQKFEFIFFQKF